MELIKSKTFWTGVGSLVAAVAGYLTGQADLMQAAQLAATGLAAIFLRQGMAKPPQDY